MNIAHTLAVIPYSMHNIADVPLVLYQVSARPKQLHADRDRFHPTPLLRSHNMHNGAVRSELAVQIFEPGQHAPESPVV